MFTQLTRSIRAKVNVPDGEMETIRQFFIPKKIRKRQFLLNEGDVCQYLAFVERGLLRSYSVDEDGQEHVIQFAMEGWWVSDMCSFLSGDPAVYTMEAIEDTELLMLSKDSMDNLMEASRNMERYFRLLMQNNIVALQRRVLSSLSYAAEEKYLRLIETCPDLINRAAQQDIASFLGITPETLSRIRKQVSKRR